MRLLLKRTKNTTKEHLYQFNVNYGALFQKTHDEKVFEDDFDLDILTIQLIKFDENLEDGYRVISQTAHLFNEKELDGRLKRLDTLVNTMRLREAIENFDQFDAFTDIEFNEKEERVSYVPRWRREKNLVNKK